MKTPLIAITADNKGNTAASGTYECAAAYCRAVAACGGLPVVLPHEVELIGEYIMRCDGFILTGGVDPDVTAFGQAMHPMARAMDSTRQAFEVGLLEMLWSAKPRAACLGVCLGMQLMGLHAGGALDQYMPETMGEAAASVHQGNKRHAVNLAVPDSVLGPPGSIPGSIPGSTPGEITSSHRQRIIDTGSLRLIAAAPDGTIEAIDDPTRPFYVGVQWHPERGDNNKQDPLNWGLIQRLVDAAAGA